MVKQAFQATGIAIAFAGLLVAVVLLNLAITGEIEVNLPWISPTV